VRSLSVGSPRRERRVLEIDAAYEARLSAGFPVTLEGNAETLQVARDIDRTNWLTLLGICDEAAGAGLGDFPIPAPGLRCTSNLNYIVTFSEAAQIIRNLRAWAAAAQGNWWRLKDLARDAAHQADLDAIDLEEGWP
jgi:hypothetical protein